MTEETIRTGKKEASVYDELLERMPGMEAWHGIRLDRLSAIYDREERELRIYCEVHPASGNKLKHDVDLIMVMYDKNDRIVDRSHTYLTKEKFFGFAVEELSFYNLSPRKLKNIGRIRVYPAAW